VEEIQIERGGRVRAEGGVRRTRRKVSAHTESMGAAVLTVKLCLKNRETREKCGNVLEIQTFRVFRAFRG
jgi:hypothetical protein